MTERFNSTILSVAPAPPGWRVRLCRMEVDTQTRKVETKETWDAPVVAWVLVHGEYTGGTDWTEVEPLFLDNGRLIHSTSLRRRESDLTPEPGDPRITVDIDLYEAP